MVNLSLKERAELVSEFVRYVLDPTVKCGLHYAVAWQGWEPSHYMVSQPKHLKTTISPPLPASQTPDSDKSRLSLSWSLVCSQMIVPICISGVV
jgi:hypothetical protein